MDNIEEKAFEYAMLTGGIGNTEDDFTAGYRARDKVVVKVIEAEIVKNDAVIANSHLYKAAIYMGRNEQLRDLLTTLILIKN